MAKKFDNGLLFRTAAVTALCTGFVFSSGAYAQEADEEAPVTTTPAAEGSTEDRTLDTVRVTGSRLANPYTSTAPLDIISADAAALQGITDVATLLQTATVAAGSPQVTAATSSAFVQNGGVGAETISLRGLGANRTLTLINGRRAGAAGTRGGVSAFDLNAIPLSAVSNIEILKDGASSIYGSDAVAGVVNIITKRDAGAEVDFFYSGPEEKGGEQLRASGTWSGAVTDRGNLLVSLDYTKREELARGQRDYFNCGEAYVFGADGERADLIDPRTNSFHCNDLAWGHVWLYNYDAPNLVGRPFQGRPQLLQYDYDGSLAANGLAPWGPNDFGLALPPEWFPVALGELLLPGAVNDPFYSPTARLSEALLNADHPFQDDESLLPETERMTFFASADYEVTNAMQVYGEVLLNRRETKVNGYRQFWQYDYAYNYFGYTYTNNPSAIANGFVSAPSATGNFIGFSPTAITDHSDTNVSVDYVNAVIGAKGDFAVDGWNWDAFFQFSRSDGDYTQDVIFDDSITPYQWFNTYGSCANDPDGLTDVRGVACITPDWYSPEFLAGNISQTDRDFLFGVDTGNTVYEQAQLEVFLDGPLFAMPAGQVIAGIGVSRIAERINDVPGETFQAGNAWGSSSAGITRGRKTTRAIFGELSVPLFSDQPFAEAVDLSLSARLTDVDVYGSDTTYKAGLGWQVTPEFRLRSTYGTSFRAPALFELYLDSQTSFASQRSIDPCINWGGNLANGDVSQRLADNCAADGISPTYNGAGSSATVFESGNAGNLEAETSKAVNVGAIWSPSFADFRVSVDYFSIEIEDQITQLGPANILSGCYNSDNFATEPLCDLFTRNPSLFLVNSVTNNFINIAEQTNQGIDVAAQYSRDFSFATLTMNTSHTFQLTDEVQLLPTSVPFDGNGEFGEPEWVGEVSATLDRGPWSLFWGVDFIGKTSNVESFGGNTGTYLGEPVTFKLETEQTTYHNVSLSRELPFDITVLAGVSNLFGENPPAVTTLGLGEYSTVGTSAFTSQYDWLGRRFFLSVNKKF